MNCPEAREHLPEHLYGGLPADVQQALHEHLTRCPSCAEAWRGLQGVRQALDAPPTPAVHVDLPRLYQQALDEDRRRLRRWRGLAWTAAAAAAVLLVLTMLRFEVRWHERELVLGWGLPKPVPPMKIVPEEPALPTAVLADLQLVKDLIHSMVADMDERQLEHAATLANVEQRLEAIQSMSNRRWLATQNDVRALYTAYFGPREKGANP